MTNPQHPGAEATPGGTEFEVWATAANGYRSGVAYSETHDAWRERDQAKRPFIAGFKAGKAVPAGFVLVPLKPTPEMLGAGHDAGEAAGGFLCHKPYVPAVWKAMLAEASLANKE